MTLTTNIVLKLDISNVPLSLGDDIEHVLRILSNYKVSREDDLEMGRSYLLMIERGVELTFKLNQLSSVFLYITKGPENLGLFDGETDLLKKEIIQSQDEKLFSETLESKGFRPTEKVYPFAVDRLNDSIRIRLEKREGRAIILIDNGAMVR